MGWNQQKKMVFKQYRLLLFELNRFEIGLNSHIFVYFFSCLSNVMKNYTVHWFNIFSILSYEKRKFEHLKLESFETEIEFFFSLDRYTIHSLPFNDTDSRMMNLTNIKKNMD